MLPDGCPACGATDSRPFLDTTDDKNSRGAAAKIDQPGSSRQSAGAVRLVRCRRCGLAWQDPMPPAERLAQAYGELHDDLYVAERAGRNKALRRCLGMITRYTGESRGCLLDVGCSAGFFLGLAQAAGWSVYGVEPSTWLSRRAQDRFGARVVAAMFADAPFAAQTFDAITLWDVLEHVADPRGMLEKVAHLLRPGGVVALNVPNIKSAIARLMGRHWPLLLPEHLYYFTRASLRLLLERQGLMPLGFHLHPVYFSSGYVFHRLAQHRVPGARLGGQAVRRLRLQDWSIPLLMGEITVVARQHA